MQHDHGAVYDAWYFARGCGRPYRRDEEWLGFFDAVAARIVRDIGPRTVLDAGCAFGFLVEALRRRGVDAHGIDVSDFAIDQVSATARPYCHVASVTEPLTQPYDLIVCIEVLEHVAPREAEEAIDNFAAHSGDVLFSSTPHDFAEATHVNVRPPDYWAEAFARRGLVRDVDFDASFLTDWAVRFRRSDEPPARVMAAYERRLWLLDQEVRARRELNLQQRSELSSLSESVADIEALARERDAAVAERDALRRDWQLLRASPGGRLLRALQAGRAALAPPGSRRAAWLERMLPPAREPAPDDPTGAP